MTMTLACSDLSAVGMTISGAPMEMKGYRLMSISSEETTVGMSPPERVNLDGTLCHSFARTHGQLCAGEGHAASVFDVQRRGRLKGDFPHLEGKSVKYLRFKDESEANARAAELAAITCAWCDQDTPRPKHST
jgi:hypothetical protein